MLKKFLKKCIVETEPETAAKVMTEIEKCIMAMPVFYQLSRLSLSKANAGEQKGGYMWQEKHF